MLVELNAFIGRNYACKQSFGAELEVTEGTELQYDSWGNKTYKNYHVKSLPVGDGKLNKIKQLFEKNTKNVPGTLSMFITNSQNSKGKSDTMYVTLSYHNGDYFDRITVESANDETFGR